MPQWPRHQESSSPAPANDRGTLVMAYWISVVNCPLRNVVRVRRQTCFNPGQLSYPARRVLVWRKCR